jgi:PAS domain S-box-containing protein
MGGNQNQRILVVDDQVELGKNLATQLRVFGFDTRFAENADSAKSACREFQPDIAFVDIRLGEDCGLELVAELIANDPAPTCVMVTENSDIGSAIDALRHGAYDYLMKPVDERTLRSSLHRCFAYRDLEQEKLEAEARIRSSEERYRVLANLSPVGILHTDEHRNCLFVNERWQQITGCSAEGAMGDGWVSSVYPEDRKMVSGEWWRARDENRPFHAEYRFGDTEENVTWVLGQSVAIRDENGSTTGYVGTITDISLSKSMEKTLADIHQMQTLGEISGNVAHHLNNMLAVVSGNIEIALFSMDDEEKARTSLDKALEATYRIGNLTQQLLSYSRRQFLMVEPVDLNEALRQQEYALQARMPDGVTLQFDLADVLWQAKADSNQFTRAIDAIVTNAVEAIDGAGKIHITSENKTVDKVRPKLDPGNYVMITIADSGRGMDAETMLRATEPFYTTKEIGAGTGLGISMAYGFARQSGGGLLIESELGQGSSVRVFLPRIEENS